MTVTAAPRLLLVDDDPLVLLLLARTLKEAGFHVARVHSGPDALAWLEQQPEPQEVAVITDIGMPGMDGCTLARHVLRRWPGTRLLFISGYPWSDLAARGCPDDLPLLAKPFTLTELLARVEQMLLAPAWVHAGWLTPEGGR